MKTSKRSHFKRAFLFTMYSQSMDNMFRNDPAHVIFREVIIRYNYTQAGTHRELNQSRGQLCSGLTQIDPTEWKCVKAMCSSDRPTVTQDTVI